MRDHVHIATGKIFPRGAKPTPKHIIEAAPKHKATAVPPFFFILPRTLSMWGNGPDPNWPDPGGDGNCVSAEEAFNKACAGIFIQDQTLYTWCVANGTLNGANLQPVIQQMQSAGFVQDGNTYGDGPGTYVDYTNAAILQSAIYQAGQMGGCVKFGLAANELPAGAGNNQGWFMTNNSPDTNEDHCMGACGFGTAQQFCDAMNASGLTSNLTVPAGVDPTMQGYAIYTWSTIGFSSVQDFVNFAGEAWIRNPSSITIGTGTPTPDSVYTTGGPIPPPPIPTPTPTPTPTPSPQPLPPVGSVTIPPYSFQVPHLFGSQTVTIPGGTYPVVYSASATSLPPWLITVLKDACQLAPFLPPPWNNALAFVCSFIPANALPGDSIVIPPWLGPVILAVISYICANIALIPVSLQPIAQALCSILPHAKAHFAKCGCL